MVQEGRTPAKYRQIAADLRARIEGGEFPVGSQMPTKDELMKSYGAALATVDNALRVLRKLEMVESRQGSGTFVLAQQAAEVEADQLGGQVAELQKEVAELRQRTGRIEARLATLAGQSRGGKREQANTAASDGRR